MKLLEPTVVHARPVRRLQRPRPRAAALFPGDRRVWWTAGAVAVVFLGILVAALLTPRDYYTGTNSVRTRSFVAELHAGSRLCVPRLAVPGGTGIVEIEVASPTNPRPLLDATLALGGRTIAAGSVPPGPVTQGQKVGFRIPELPSKPALTAGTLCVRSHGKAFVGGMGGLQANDVSPTLGGKPLGSRVAVWFRPPAGEKRTYASLLPTIFERAALFRPGFVGAWTYWLALFAVVPLLVYAGIRLIATSAARGRRRIPLAFVVGALAFANAAVWAVVTPSFQAPDESEHFAYAQYFAETGKAVGSTGNAYSTEESLGLDAMRVFSSNEKGDGKPPWNRIDERNWERAVAAIPGGPARNNGGLAVPATSNHAPVYYALLAPAYRATRGASVWSQLAAMRLISALFGAIVAACAFLIVRELLPRRLAVAVAAGLIVAFEPMFGFISGSVNNDVGVNAAAAVTLYLLIRGVVRGLTRPLAVALGIALAVTPLFKGTGFAIYPAAALALAGMLWRRRAWNEAASVGIAVLTAGLVFEGWSLLAPAFHRSAVTTPGGAVPGTGTAAAHQIGGYLSYLWEVFLPRLPGMAKHWSIRWPAFDIYAVRGWGSFGWYAQTFAHWVYKVIALGMLLVAGLSATALWRNRARLRPLVLPLLVLGTAIAAVVAGVHYYFYTPTPRIGIVAEMGRYVFPAITALAAAAMGACFAFGRRAVVPIATTLATAVMLTGFAGQITELARFYAG